MASFKPTITLNNGLTIPAIGFGSGTALYGRECTEQVVAALKAGYRYLDCAQTYSTSKYVGAALKEWGGKREDVYVLTKCGMWDVPYEQIEPRKVLKEQLKELGLDYVDMYLMHGPLFTGPLTLSENWKVLEELQAEGLTKSIGVSNYREEDLLEMEKEWKVPPAVNQIEYHPYVAHAPHVQRLLATMAKHDIKVQSYGPQASLVHFKGGAVDPVVDRIAADKGITPSQVLLRWAAQTSGGIVVTTSRDTKRQKEQLEAITAVAPLSDADVAAITAAGQSRFARHFMLRIWDKAKP